MQYSAASQASCDASRQITLGGLNVSGGQSPFYFLDEKKNENTKSRFAADLSSTNVYSSIANFGLIADACRRPTRGIGRHELVGRTLKGVAAASTKFGRVARRHGWSTHVRRREHQILLNADEIMKKRRGKMRKRFFNVCFIQVFTRGHLADVPSQTSAASQSPRLGRQIRASVLVKNLHVAKLQHGF